jgi:ABC-type transporter Mla subunit MlaD
LEDTVNSTVVNRIAGFASVVLLLAVGYLGVQYALESPRGSFEVTAVLGERAGQAVASGTDVKARGIIVGEVLEVYIDENAQAEATLIIHPGHSLPSPDRLAAQVTSKTFLGDKQLDLLVDGPLGEPYLQAGDVIEVPDGLGPREPTDLFDAFGEVMAAIPGPELGALYEAFGTPDLQDAEIAGENIELSEQWQSFTARVAEQQLDNFERMAGIMEELAPRAEDLNRIFRTVPTWATLLPDRQQDVRRNLEQLSSLTTGFAEFLEVTEADLSELMQRGRITLEMLEPRIFQVGDFIYGAFRYYSNFHHGQLRQDGSEAGHIRVFLLTFEEMCAEMPDEMRDSLGEAFIPGCPPPRDEPVMAGHEREEGEG